MDKLPVETLCDIFLKSLPERSSECFIRERSPMKYVLAPLYLSHVCQRWRALSLSTGELWSYLHLDFTETRSSVHERRKRMVDVLNTWIERTNGSPLNFTIWCNKDAAVTYKDPHIASVYIISTLLAEKWRWKDVEFLWPESLVRVEMTNMPMLTSFSLQLFEDGSSRRNNLVLKETNANVSIERSSRLRQLYLRGNYILNVGEEPIYTLTGPVHLGFMLDTPRMVAERSCLGLLRVARNLKRFHAEFLPARLDPNLQHTQLVHDLEMLKIDRSCMVINSLTLPNLRALSYCPFSSGSPLVPLSNFVRRSMPPLTYMMIEEFPVDEEGDSLVPILRLLPTLRYLHINSLSTPSRFFQALAVTNISVDEKHSSADNGILCPDLRYLFLGSIHFEEDVEIRADDLCSMLESRNSFLNTFKRVYCGREGVFDISDISSNVRMLEKRLETRRDMTISDGGTWRSPFYSWF